MRRFISRLVMAAGLICLIAAASTSARDHSHFFGWSFNSIKGSGNEVTVDRTVVGFDKIESSIGADMDITVGGEFKVTLTGDDNIVELVETRVHGRTLEIDSRKNFSTRRDVKLTVSMPKLTELSDGGSGTVVVHKLSGDEFTLDISGSADVTCEGTARKLRIDVAGSGKAEFSGLACDRVNVELAGSGDITLTGTSKELEIEIPGSGNVDARELKCDDVTASIDGSGNIDVWADQSLDGSVNGSGDIYYWGNATDISRDVNGSGRIVHKR